jgi:hypothetical protein
MVAAADADADSRRLGWITFGLVAGKAALAALTGQVLFSFLHFGLLGEPFRSPTPGEILGGLRAMFCLGLGKRARLRAEASGAGQWPSLDWQRLKSRCSSRTALG